MRQKNEHAKLIRLAKSLNRHSEIPSMRQKTEMKNEDQNVTESLGREIRSTITKP